MGAPVDPMPSLVIINNIFNGVYSATHLSVGPYTRIIDIIKKGGAMQREQKINVPARLTYILSTHGEVVECILQHLSFEDLTRAAKVNTVWRKAVSQILQSRTRLELAYKLYKEDEITETTNPFETLILLDQLPSFCLCFESFQLQERLGGYVSARKMLQKSLPPTCENLLVTSYRREQMEVTKLTFFGPNVVRGFEFRAHDDVDIQVEGLSFLLLFGDAKTEAKQAIDKTVLGVRRICKYIRAVGVLISDGNQDPGFVKGVAFYGNDIEVNHVFLSCRERSRESIAARIRKLPNKSYAQSVVILFSEYQRYCQNIDEEEIRAYLPNTPVVQMHVSDVLLLASKLEDPVQMKSTINEWRWEQPRGFYPMCDTRGYGPGLALLISRPH